jgi:hypothetical protein
MPRGRTLSLAGRTLFLLVWLISAVYVFPFRLRGWIPTDEGVFAHSAERVLDGEMPHRDFPEVYTGGLSYWNAFALRVFGLRLTSIRLALFLCFLAFVPAVFAIASRFGNPLWSGLITFLAVAWSLPNYFAGSVSWYNLFLATWGTLALLRYVETGQRRWLLVAGALAGISCLFKVIGAYFVAAALLFLLYREQQLSRPPGSPAGRRRLSAYLLFQAAGLSLFLALLIVAVRSQPGEMELLSFVAPAVMLAAFLVSREFLEGGGRFARRLSLLMRSVLPFAAGVLLPILLFLAVFAWNGALDAVIGGVVSGTSAHVRLIRSPLPAVSSLWPAVPYTVVLGAGSLAPFRFARRFRVVLAIALAAALWLSGTSEQIYQDIWSSARFLGVAAVFAVCLRLRDAHRSGLWSSETRQKLFLLAAVVAMTGLVQFPFAAPIYFLYVAPLVALAIFSLVESEPHPPWRLHAAMLAFYLLFALLRANRGSVISLGVYPERFDPPAVLDLPRAGGIRVSAVDAAAYGSLIPLVQEKSGGGPIYAGPDCDQVYFLSGLRDVVSYRAGSPRDPMKRPEDVFRRLEGNSVRAIVWNRAPLFADQLPPRIVARFEELFPHSRSIGQFTARWRD